MQLQLFPSPEPGPFPHPPGELMPWVEPLFNRAGAVQTQERGERHQKLHPPRAAS